MRLPSDSCTLVQETDGSYAFHCDGVQKVHLLRRIMDNGRTISGSLTHERVYGMPWPRSSAVAIFNRFATTPKQTALSMFVTVHHHRMTSQIYTYSYAIIPNNQAERKEDKYAELAATHHFVPVAIETMGVFGKEAEAFFIELGRRIREETGEPLSFHYLLQRIAVAMQRGNAAAVLRMWDMSKYTNMASARPIFLTRIFLLFSYRPKWGKARCTFK